jgi:hypothetical protein
VLVATEGISAARTDAFVVIVPIAVVLADLVLLPTFVLAIVVMVFIAAVVLVPAFVFAIIVMLVAVAMFIAVLGRSGQGQSAGQRAQHSPQN